MGLYHWAPGLVREAVRTQSCQKGPRCSPVSSFSSTPQVLANLLSRGNRGDRKELISNVLLIYHETLGKSQLPYLPNLNTINAELIF